MKNMKIKLTNKIQIFNAPDAFKKELMKLLTMPNPKWLENRRMGRWNGHTEKLLQFFEESRRKISIPIGCLDEFKELTLTKIIDKRTVEGVEVDIQFNTQLYPVQQRAMSRMLEGDAGTLQAPTGSGKTVMGIYAMSKRGQKTLIIVHTKELLYQWIDRVNAFTNIDSDEIGVIGNGQYRIGERLTIGMVQSIYKKTDELKKVFGFLIVDEAHRCPSRTFTTAVSAFHAKYKLGLSATAFRRDGLSDCIFLYLGPLRHEIDEQELFDTGQILQPKFMMRGTTFRPMYDPVAEYTKMLSEITQDQARNKLICRDIRRYKKSDKCCIVLSDRKAHCHELKQLLKKLYKIDAVVLTGDAKHDERKEIIRNIEPGKNQFVIATGQLIGEGFDCKNLNILFLASPIKFSGRVIQYIGRVMRSADGKERPIVYDYVDWEVGVLANSAKGRVKVYGEENIEYK